MKIGKIIAIIVIVALVVFLVTRVTKNAEDAGSGSQGGDISVSVESPVVSELSDSLEFSDIEADLDREFDLDADKFEL